MLALFAPTWMSQNLTETPSTSTRAPLVRVLMQPENQKGG